jgi:hypothetical protein
MLSPPSHNTPIKGGMSFKNKVKILKFTTTTTQISVVIVGSQTVLMLATEDKLMPLMIPVASRYTAHILQWID